MLSDSKIAMAAANRAIALIMAGGSGTRFWPASTKAFPKQYLPLIGRDSLIQLTVKRIESLVPASQVYICSQQSHLPILKEQLPAVTHHILEPMGKNTAPCLALSAIELLAKGEDPNTVMVVLPADHFISDDKGFCALMREAIDFARESQGLVTFGIVPGHPHTGYGYIETGEPAGKTGVFKIRQFVEKPNLDKAKEYLKKGTFYWNSGIFVWTLQALKSAFEKHAPDLWKTLSQAQTQGNIAQAYEKIQGSPIDIAVMEKATNGFIFRMELPWSDLGSWSALWELLGQGKKETLTLSGNSVSIDSEGCLVKVAPQRKVALIGVKDLIVVESGDKLLITHRDSDQKVRQAAEKLD